MAACCVAGLGYIFLGVVAVAVGVVGLCRAVKVYFVTF